MSQVAGCIRVDGVTNVTSDLSISNSLTVGSLNVNGVRSKVMPIKQLLIRYNLDVLILVETRHTQEFKLAIPSYLCFESPPEDQGGVICLCKEYLKPRQINAYCNQSLTIMVHHGDRRTYITGVYNHQGNQKTFNSVQAEAEHIMRNWINPGILIAGDFNNLKSKFRKYFQTKGFFEFSPEVTWQRDQTLKNGEARKLYSSIDAIFSSKNLENQTSFQLPWTDHCLLVISIEAEIDVQKFIGTKHIIDRIAVSKLLKEQYANISLLDDYRSWIANKVKPLPISTKIARPASFYNDPFTVDWARKDKEFRAEEIKKVLTEAETWLDEGNIGKFYSKCRQLFKELKKQSLAKSPICKSQSVGFKDFYSDMFNAKGNFEGWNDWIDVEKIENLDIVIDSVSEIMPRGKALGDDLFPDNFISKEHMGELIRRDGRRLIMLPLSSHLLKSRGLLLSKTGKEVVTPEKTRLINIIPFPLKVVDKITNRLVSDDLWKQIGEYQQGFRPKARTFEHIRKVMDWMKFGKKGRKRKTYLIFFDLKKAFDSIDRIKAIEILKTRLDNEEKIKLLKKLLSPMDIELSDKQSFSCKKGMPQGMSISPVVFNSVLDHELKDKGLLDHTLLAWADDLTFVATSKTELCSIINKMLRLGCGLEVNLEKSSIMVLGDNEFKEEKFFKGIPISNTAKYLGIRFFSSSTETYRILKGELKSSLERLRIRSNTIPLKIRLDLLWRIQQARLLYQIAPFFQTGYVDANDVRTLQIHFLRKVVGANNSASTTDIAEITQLKLLNLEKLKLHQEDQQKQDLNKPQKFPSEALPKPILNVEQEYTSEALPKLELIINCKTPEDEPQQNLQNLDQTKLSDNKLQDWQIKTAAIKLIQNRQFNGQEIVRCKDHNLPIGKLHYCFMSEIDQIKIQNLQFDQQLVERASLKLNLFIEELKKSEKPNKLKLIPEKLSFISENGPVMSLIRKLTEEKRKTQIWKMECDPDILLQPT